jgi:hypothetical protein
VTVQLDEPLHARMLQASLVQVTGVPSHVPASVHISECVHICPSSQARPGLGVDVQVAVPLQS